MPNIRCSVCGDSIYVKQKDTKLLDPTSRNFCSTDCLLLMIHSCHPNGTQLLELEKHRQGSYYSEELKTFFMSKYEESVALFLRDNSLKYAYEDYYFPVATTVYIPDFYLPEQGCFLEVKGAYGVGSKNKMARFRTTYPEEILLTIPWNMRYMFR